MTAALTDTEVARLRGLLDALDSALRLHDSTTDHHLDAAGILRAMNAAGRGEEVAEQPWNEDGEAEPHPIGTVVEDADGHVWTRRPNGMWSVTDADGWADFTEVTRYGDAHTIATDTPTPAPDVTVEVRAPRWHKGEDGPDWLVPGAMVRVVKCRAEPWRCNDRAGEFVCLDDDDEGNVRYVVGSRCRHATVLELVAPAPEPSVDWEARAKAAAGEFEQARRILAIETRHREELQGRIDQALACRANWGGDDADSGPIMRRMGRILRGES